MRELNRALEDIALTQCKKNREEWDKRSKYSGGFCPACEGEFKTSSIIGFLCCSCCSLSVEEKDIRELQYDLELHHKLIEAIKHFFNINEHYIRAITDRDFIASGAEVQRLIGVIENWKKEG